MDDIRAMLRLNYERPARRLVGKVDRALEDIDALAELLTEGATVVNDAGKRVVGREAFRTIVKAARAAAGPTPATTLTFDAADFPSADLAIIRATRRLRAGADVGAGETSSSDEGDAGAGGPDELPAVACLTLTATRDADGNWLIAAMQATPLAAKPAPAETPEPVAAH